MPAIEFQDVSYTYEGARSPAVDAVSLSIADGEYVAVLGANGSGKSTLVRLMNGLRLPTSGKALVRGHDTSDPDGLGRARAEISLVFQSPVDQIVSSVVEEDVAFGPENLGLPRTEIETRVTDALRAVGLESERFRHPQFLSAGQQQRLAVAGAIAMRSSIFAFDEATAMLDPRGRASVLDLMDALRASGATIVHVTHDLDEAARAGRVVVLARGSVAFDGSPADLFGDARLGDWGLSLPESADCARALGLPPLPGETPAALAARVARTRKADDPKSVDAVTAADVASRRADAASTAPASSGAGAIDRDAVFALDSVSFSYLKGTLNERPALEGATFSVPRGAMVALVGQTGSGKSTILQLLDAIALPASGTVRSFGFDTRARKTDRRALRMRAPLSVQKPESALFEFYAGDDVAYGPRNKGLRGRELTDAVKRSMEKLGLPFDGFRDRRSASLSGGEKRKLALAGVFAMEPDALVLDEPTSALDPRSKRAVMESLRAFVGSGGTVVFSTHSMEEAARADLVGVMRDGRLVAYGKPAELFYDSYDPAWGIGLPFVCECARELGLPELKPLSASELAV